ncbi:MAG: thioredoxin family protein [Candidatus Hydrogenedentes bacterium]|nr:thioredoxin family protein [Candidatus Hydrogenedentota bacterium]
MKVRLVISCLLWIGATAIAAAQTGPVPAKPSLATEVKLASDAGRPGEPIRAAIVATLSPGWHMNANKPLDKYLIPTQITFEPSDSFRVDEVVYPEAQTVQLAFSDNPLAVYAGTIVIGAQFHAADTLAPGSYVIKGTIRYQACNDAQCFAPQKVPVEIPVTVVPVSQALAAKEAEIFAKLNFTGVAGAVSPESAPQAPKETAPASAPAAAKETPVSEENWRSLAERFTVAGEGGGYKNAQEFLALLASAESGQTPHEAGMFEGKSLLLVLFLTLLGGLALNLTPCVLPLIPINLAIIGAGARAGSRSRGFMLGGMYGLGMALVYGGLGAAVVLTASTFGGGINASPWFNGAIAIVFMLLGLAMFDLIVIDFSRFQSKFGIKKKEKGSVVVAFVMGAIAALLAGACVAPVVIAVILFSRDLYAQGSIAGLLLPFVLGLGMALPWPVAGAGMSLLPKPGKWMIRVKYVFGVVILGLAVYYAHESYGLFTARSEASRQAVEASANSLAEEGWTTSLARGLAEAEKTQKPVFIDFWATWCKNCLVMNETTFKDSQVKERLNHYVKVKYQAEFMDELPARDIVQYYEVVGLPSYVILHPNAKL